MSSFFRVRFGMVQRSRGGSAIRRAAYQSCSFLRAPDGEIFDQSADRELHGHMQTLMMAPTGSPSWALDVEACWGKAALAEKRADAQEARSLEIALPHFLPKELWDPCVREIAARFVTAGMVVQADIHAPIARTGVLNLHAHLLLSLRRIENGEFSRHKAREWNRMFYSAPKQLRGEIAAVLSEFCRQHGVPFRADARSNAERGLPAPESTIPRWNILLFQRRGVRSAWLGEIETGREARKQLTELERELAVINRLLHDEATRQRYQITNPARSVRPSICVPSEPSVSSERHNRSSEPSQPDPAADELTEAAAVHSL
jgi:MobA/MobL family